MAKSATTVAEPKATKTDINENRVKILKLLTKHAGGLTGKEIATKAGIDSSTIGYLAGYRNPEINEREVHANNLLNKNLVKLNKEEGRGFVYVITKAGSKVASK